MTEQGQAWPLRGGRPAYLSVCSIALRRIDALCDRRTVDGRHQPIDPGIPLKGPTIQLVIQPP